MHQSPLGIAIFDLNGFTIQINKAWEELWGITREELESCPKQYNILEDEQLKKKGIDMFVERAYAGEAVFVPANEYDSGASSNGIGNEKYVDTNIYPIKNESGKVINIVVVHTDVAKHKQVEKGYLDLTQKSA